MEPIRLTPAHEKVLYHLIRYGNALPSTPEDASLLNDLVAWGYVEQFRELYICTAKARERRPPTTPASALMAPVGKSDRARTPEATDAVWFVIHSGCEIGPLRLAELLAKARTGQIAPQDLVSTVALKQAGAEWIQAADFAFLQDQFNRATEAVATAREIAKLNALDAAHSAGDDKLLQFPAKCADANYQAGASMWYVIHAGVESGPWTVGELVERSVNGNVVADDLVRENNGLWVKAREVYYLQFLRAESGRAPLNESVTAIVAYLQAGFRRAKAADRQAILGWVVIVALLSLCGVGVFLARGDLTGTSWHGGEVLPGFGPLTFEFRKNNVAIMRDARGVVNGTWSRSGDQVTIRFLNCEYQGNVTGSEISGTARYFHDWRAWPFSVRRN